MAGEPEQVVVGDLAGRKPVDAGVEHVRAQAQRLDAVRVDQRARKRAGDAEPAQRAAPAELQRAVLVEARDLRVPRDVGRDDVDARVARRGDPLDPAAVGAAAHADTRVARRGPGAPRAAARASRSAPRRRAPRSRASRSRPVRRSCRSRVDPRSARCSRRCAAVQGRRCPRPRATRSSRRSRRASRTPGRRARWGAVACGKARGREEVQADRRAVERLDRRVTCMRGGRQCRERADHDRQQRAGPRARRPRLTPVAADPSHRRPPVRFVAGLLRNVVVS